MMETKTRKSSTYAIYKGDTFLCIGTKSQCAETLCITQNNLDSLISKGKHGKISCENRLIAVKLDGEE